MPAPRPERIDAAAAPHRPLDPALVRFMEALADAAALKHHRESTARREGVARPRQLRTP